MMKVQQKIPDYSRSEEDVKNFCVILRYLSITCKQRLNLINVPL